MSACVCLFVCSLFVVCFFAVDVGCCCCCCCCLISGGGGCCCCCYCCCCCCCLLLLLLLLLSVLFVLLLLLFSPFRFCSTSWDALVIRFLAFLQCYRSYLGDVLRLERKTTGRKLCGQRSVEETSRNFRGCRSRART